MESSQTFEEFLQKLKNPLSISDFKSLCQKYTIIDTRPFGESTGLIKGSYWLPNQTILTSLIRSILQPSQPYLLVCERQNVDEVLECMALMGYLNIMGYNNFDMKRYDGQLEYPVLRKWNQLGDNQKKQLVDIRNPQQGKKTGVVKKAMLIDLYNLDKNSEDKLNLLKKISGKRLVVVHCKSGQRSKVASSILFRHGIPSITLTQSIQDFPKLGLKLAPVQENEQYWRKKLQKTYEDSEQEDQNKAEKQLQTDNMNRMQIEQCYEECLRDHPQKSTQQCQMQCQLRSGRNHQENIKMQHSENKNQFQASKMRITPSKHSQQQRHFQNLNEQITHQGKQKLQIQPLSEVFKNIEEHKYTQASNLLSKMIFDDPMNSNLYINRAMCHIKLKQEKQAENDLNEAIEKDRLNFIPYFDLASLKLSLSDSKQCKLTALENLYCSLSCVYLKNGLKSHQDKDFQNAIHYSPNNIQAFAFLTLKALQKGNLDQCLQNLQKMDLLTEHRNELVKSMLQKVNKKIEQSKKSDNPESSKQLTEQKITQREQKLIIEHFGSSQFGSRLVGKIMSFSQEKDIDKQVRRAISEWNKLYKEIIDQGPVELHKIDEIANQFQGKSLMNGRKTVWIME